MHRQVTRICIIDYSTTSLQWESSKRANAPVHPTNLKGQVYSMPNTARQSRGMYTMATTEVPEMVTNRV